jgi:branched-chain amino acid transport system permease protein
MILFANQLLNGLQLGLMLFLLAAGLSLVFGIMDFINLAHGVFYMIGAYVCATIAIQFDSFFLGLLIAIPATLLVALILERALVRHLYKRDHLDQVLATFGLVLCFDTAVKYIWGPDGLSVPLPKWLGGQINLAGITLPTYRIFVIAVGAIVAVALWQVIARTKLGMMVRAAASNEQMARAIGIDTRLIFAFVFAIGAMLAAIAGVMVAPITGASIGMGNQVVILALVVIIIGGIGSITGSFAASMAIGLIDTLGRAYLPDLMSFMLPAEVASAAGPSLASILIYLTMTLVLVFKPAGLFPPATR